MYLYCLRSISIPSLGTRDLQPIALPSSPALSMLEVLYKEAPQDAIPSSLCVILEAFSQIGTGRYADDLLARADRRERRRRNKAEFSKIWRMFADVEYGG